MESTDAIQRMFGRACVNQLDADEPCFVIVDPRYWQDVSLLRPTTPKEFLQTSIGVLQQSSQCYVIRPSVIRFWLAL